MGYRFPLKEQSRVQPSRWWLSGLLATGLLWGQLSWAQAKQLINLDYQTGVFNIQGSLDLPRPALEVWPSGSKEQPTELLIVSFAGVDADLAALEQQVIQIRLAHPELKQFIVSGDQNEFTVVLERPLPAGNQPQKPNVIQASSTQWQLAWGAAGQTGDSSKTLSSKRQAKSPGQTARPQQQAVPPADSSTSEAAQAQLLDMAEQLTSTVNERNRLEARVIELEHQLNEKQSEQTVLQEQMTLYEDWIRPYDPSLNDPHTRQQVVIANLRKALLKVAKQLKNTETALSAQADITRKLARELAEIKHDPAIAADPALIATVPDPDAEEKSQAKPEQKPAIIYHAPQQNTAARKTDDPPEEEVMLQVAIKENPQNYEAYLKLADWYAGHGQLGEAESMLTRLIGLNPRFAQAYYYLALVYLGQERSAEAQAALDTYQRLSPKDTANIRPTQQAIRTLSAREGQKHRASGKSMKKN